MGTMGEYGTPNTDIPEGFFEIEFHGRKDYLPFPRQAGSWYHWSKVFDSGDVMLASKIFDLARDRRDAGGHLRDPDGGDHRRPPPHPVRFRRDLGDRAQPVHRPGRAGPPDHPLREGGAEAGVHRARGLDAVAPARGREPRLRRASTASSTSSTRRTRSTSSPDRVARIATVPGPPPDDRASPRPAGRGGAALLQPDPRAPSRARLPTHAGSSTRWFGRSSTTSCGIVAGSRHASTCWQRPSSGASPTAGASSRPATLRGHRPRAPPWSTPVPPPPTPRRRARSRCMQ